MAARSLFETEILPFSLRQAIGHLDARQSVVDIIEQRIDAETADKIGKIIFEILRETNPENVDIGEADFPKSSTESLASRINNQRNIDGSPQRMDFIKVKDASLTVGISLVALSIAIATLSASGVGSALNAAKGVYDNWVVLKDEKDTDAMRAYDALLKYAAEAIADSIPAKNPERASLKYTELHEFGGPTPETSMKALKRLKKLGLVEIVDFDESNGEVDNPGNKWAIRA